VQNTVRLQFFDPRFYSVTVKLKLCPKCKRPFLETDEFCPKCPRPYWNPESYMNLGCLLIMLMPLIGLIVFWLVFFLGPLFRLGTR
jgi:hypothetical protein